MAQSSQVGGDVRAVEALATAYAQLRSEVGKVIVGQDKIVEQLIIALLAKGHCLLVGVPGLAKTLLIKTIADVMHCSFNRVQFTPDLMPSDITGTEIIEEDQSTGQKHFRFIRGPIFANILLADEINRTPPKTQAALLEAMQEHRVTAAGNTLVLDEPFFVLATQNPIEQEGTYPLPEAQLDRFMFNLWLDYPTFDEEVRIVETTTSPYAADVKKVISHDDIIAYQELVRRVPVSDNVVKFAVSLVAKTRPDGPDAPKMVKDFVSWGAGPRASQYLVLAAKTRAVLNGRFTPDIDDVRAAARPVLRHRIVLNFNAEAENIDTVKLVDQLL